MSTCIIDLKVLASVSRRIGSRLGMGVGFLLLALPLAVPALGSPAEVPISPAADTSELAQRIGRILTKNSVPGATIVLTDARESLWLAGIGKADVSTGRQVTPDTLFRIGSVSKTFVALAVLRLVEEGRLSLDDKVRDLVPEVRFENRWEATDPVRVVHLLEHTAGWDDIHLKEYASSDPKPLTLAEGLGLGPESRTSRWRPGTRFSYCNSGPAVAAAIVEKKTGKRFEELVREWFFLPIGMPNADYFLSPHTENLLTRLYHPDGKKPYPYWHVGMRPAGSINASAREMGAYLRFFLNRGAVNGTRLPREASIRRMEEPGSGWGAKAGLITGYGLHNYTVLDDGGFVWHGHNGGVDGGFSEMLYLPEQGIGYFFSINGGSGRTVEAISKEVQAFLERGLSRPPDPRPWEVPDDLKRRASGWYVPDSPRMEALRFAEQIAGLNRFSFDGDQLIVRPLLGARRVFVPTGPNLFRGEKKSAAALALIDTEDGLVAQASLSTGRRIGTPRALLSIGVTVLFLAALVSVPLFALVWGVRWLFGRLRGVPNLHLRVLPLLAVLSLAGAVLTIFLSVDDAIARFGARTIWSMSFVALMAGYGLLSPASLLAVLLARRQGMNRGAWLHALFVSVLLVIGALYLGWWGVIGWLPWG
ncbi:MAG: serine hydrolase [Thermoanaerobaculia bacterium]